MALPPTEIRALKDAFYTYEARYAPGRSEHLCPAPLGAAAFARVQEVAVALALLPPVVEHAEWVHVGVLWAAVVLTIGTGISYVTDGTRSLSHTGDRR